MEAFLKSCQCLLFFFDPTHSDALENESNLGAFYEGEMNEASILLEQVPKCRPQDPLPVLFIQTHRDVLETKSADDQQLAKSWLDDVFNLLKENYEKKYGKDENGEFRVH